MWLNLKRNYSGRQSGLNRRDGLGAEYQEQAQAGQIYSGVHGPMFRGYRLLIVATCGIALLIALGVGAFFGALSAPHYGYQTAHPAYRSAQFENGDPSQVDRDRAGLPYFAERMASAPDPKDTGEREQRDLAAQESMSIWAFWLLLVSAVGTVTTMIGTGFLLWQIVLTRKAVQDTGKATLAMERQNEIAVQAQRPWVRIDTKLTEFTVGNELVRVSFVVQFTNIGQTVALEFWSASQAAFVGADHPGPALANLHIWRSCIKTGGIAVMPGETVEHVGSVTLQYEEIPWEDEAENRRTRLTVMGAAYYHIPTDKPGDPMKFTERTFLVGAKHPTPGRQLYIPMGRFHSFTPENAVYSRSYPSLTS